ncbi:MAG: hypothetical protein IJZ00_08450 [Lachnospiraceae bacterium]|nr:hypothetical protein [Lachnospiraceae bacterium]MBQ8262302.1 hypothetical protein [Lachnospiraceae bacterium]
MDVQKEKVSNPAKENETSVPEDYVIGNFRYSEKESATRAITEQERIKKLESQMDYDRPQVVYAIYCKMLESNVFHSPEGLLYLVHLQNFLYEHEKQINGVIPLIPAKNFSGGVIIRKESAEGGASDDRKVKRLERRWKAAEEKNKIYKIVIAFLAVAVIFMMIIAGISDSPTILNYRQKIQNEYAEWEQQLQDWEDDLEEREELLEGK